MNNKKQFWLWGSLITLVGLSLYFLQGILMPFFTGFLVAYAMNPAVKRLQSWGIPREIGTLFMIISFLLSLALLFFIAVPFIQAELISLAYHIPQYGKHLITTLQPIFEKLLMFLQPEATAHPLRDLASTHVGDVILWGIRLIEGILTNGVALANLFSLIIVTPLVAFYCLRDWEKIMLTVEKWFPRPYASTLKKLFSEINSTIGGFVRGQILVCLVIGLYYCIALTWADLDFSLIVGLVIGILAFVPYLGAFLGFTLSIGIALSQFSDWFSIGTIGLIFLIGQTFEAYILVPYLIGDRIGLHPVWIIFALLAGGVLYGFVGLLIALPVAATMGVLLRHALEIYLKSPYYLGKGKSLTRKI